MASKTVVIDARKTEAARVALEHIEAAEDATRVQGKVLSKAFEDRTARAKALESELTKLQATTKRRIDAEKARVTEAAATIQAKVHKLTTYVEFLRDKQSKAQADLA